MARPASEIKLGEVIRATEPDFALFECFKPESPCVVIHACTLNRIMNQSFQNFLADLDRYTLTDIAIEKSEFPMVLQSPAPLVTRTSKSHID